MAIYSKLDSRAKSDTDDSVRKYLKEIGRYPLLTAEEEIALGRQVRAWLNAKKPSSEVIAAGRRAKDRMVCCNLRLVVNIAKKHQHRGVEFQALIQEGSIGLARAVEKFDPAKGYKFSTYGYWWIRQAMIRAIANDSRVIRLPVHACDALSRHSIETRKFYIEHNRHPTHKEIALILKQCPNPKAQAEWEKRLKHYLLMASPVMSIDMALPGGKDSKRDATLGDYLESPEPDPVAEVYAVEKRALALQALSGLSENQRRVIELRYGITGEKPMTLREIGQELGVSHEKIRQVQVQAMRKLRSDTRLARWLGQVLA